MIDWLPNTNVWIHQNFNYRENLTILKFWWIFLFLEVGVFVGKLMFFFTFTHFFRNKEKDMIVLIHENHDKWPNVSPVPHFCSGFDQANLISFFRGSNFCQKLDSLMCICTNISIRFVWKDDNVFAYKRKIENRANFPKLGW